MTDSPLTHPHIEHYILIVGSTDTNTIGADKQYDGSSTDKNTIGADYKYDVRGENEIPSQKGKIKKSNLVTQVKLTFFGGGGDGGKYC